jgi:hypothetical protein
MKASDAFWIFVFAAVAFVLFAPKVTKNIETNHRKELAKASYPGCGNRDCECYEDCTCIDGICVCGGPKPPAPPKPKPKPDPDVPPDDVGPEVKAVSTVQDQHLFENGQATILLYSLPGCGPCEKWWRDEAPGWVNRGWKVKRTTSKTTRPVPYFTLYDGAQFFEYFIQKDIDKFKFDGAGR